MQVTDDIKRRFGTVWTDPRVVDLVIDEALKHYRGDVNVALFCDPAAGDGNFLVNLYRRLVVLSPIADPAQRSLDVLRRLYGVEILDALAAKARLNLLTEHRSHTKGVPDPKLSAAAAIVLRNIIHGNTLRTEADTWVPQDMEAGQCPDRFRALRFNLIVSNPPYTSYGIGTRAPITKPAAYVNTKTMAESFVLWADAHLAEDGVAGLNLGDMILNGANRARERIAGQIVSVVYSRLTKDYSIGTGGDMPTVVFAFTKRPRQGPVLVNGVPTELDVTAHRFLKLTDYVQPSYRSVPIFQYSRIGARLLSGRGSKTATLDWKQMIVARPGLNGEASRNGKH